MENNDLNWWRERIDSVDEQILVLLAERQQIAERIAEVKRLNSSSILDKAREEKVIRNRQSQGDKLGLKKNYVASLWILIMNNSKEVQKEVFTVRNFNTEIIS